MQVSVKPVGAQFPGEGGQAKSLKDIFLSFNKKTQPKDIRDAAKAFGKVKTTGEKTQHYVFLLRLYGEKKGKSYLQKGRGEKAKIESF